MAICFDPYSSVCTADTPVLATLTIVPESLFTATYYLVETNASSNSFELEFYTNFKVSNGSLITALTPDSVTYGEFLLPNSELKLATKVEFSMPPALEFGNLNYRESTDSTLIPGSNCGVYHFKTEPPGGDSVLLVFGYVVLLKV